MGDILGDLQAEFGYLSARSAVQSVGETDDLRRIRDMRRRAWETWPDRDRAVHLLTRWLRPGGQRCKDPSLCKGCEAERLKPAQAVALYEAAEHHHGLWAPIRVGGGKTLVTLLLGTVLKTAKVLLVVPADLVGKTISERAQYARHWRVSPMTIKSYEWLSHPDHLHGVTEIAPEVIILDEADKAKSSSCKVWRRIHKYISKHPGTRLIVLTGSPGSRAMGEYWHLIRGALREEAPVPSSPMEAKAWGLAMDEKVPEERRFEPGALLSLADVADTDEMDPTVHARLAFQKRLTSTFGVVSTLEDVPDVPLEIHVHELELPAALREMMYEMRKNWATPGGEDFSLAVEMWRHQTTLGGCGMYQIWDPPAPAEWKARRKAWHVYARDWMRYHTKSWDSTVHLERLIEAGEVKDGGILAKWREIYPSFKPNPVPVWVDDTSLEYCAEWLRGHDDAIVWSPYPDWGQRLASLVGVPYFGSEGLDGAGRLIDDARGGTCVASLKACGRGHNLQAWYQNLFPVFPTKGGRAEQTIGRTHRDGQRRPVTVEILVTCQESYAAVAQACRDALYAQQSFGQPQKLVYARKQLGPTIESMIAGEIDWKQVGT